MNSLDQRSAVDLIFERVDKGFDGRFALLERLEVS